MVSLFFNVPNMIDFIVAIHLTEHPFKYDFFV